MQLPILHNNKSNQCLPRKNMNQNSYMTRDKIVSEVLSYVIQRHMKAAFYHSTVLNYYQMLRIPWSTQRKGTFPPFYLLSSLPSHGTASYLLPEDTPNTTHASLDHVHIFFTLLFLCLPLSFTLFTKLLIHYLPSPYSLKLWLIWLCIPSAYILSTWIT